MTGFCDSFNRPINYLRISVTDRCNLRCVYCMPAEGIRLLAHDEILNFEELRIVTKAAAELGINRVRLTGGEPLVRAGLVNLVKMLADVKGIEDISLTTNGILLSQYAKELRSAGLKRVNISLDTLRPEKFKQITRIGKLKDTLLGIEAAHESGFNPIKINMVVIRGVNDDEVVDFARMTAQKGWHVRFIEFMPIGERQQERDARFMPISEITQRIKPLGALEPHVLDGSGPAKYFRLPHATGTIGFISPVSEHFCFKCNRLRLTAEGKLRPCLLSDEEIDLRAPLRRGGTINEIKGLIEQAIAAKPEGHRLESGASARNRTMSQIGG